MLPMDVGSAAVVRSKLGGPVRWAGVALDVDCLARYDDRMPTATDAQLDLIRTLARKAGFDDLYQAACAAGVTNRNGQEPRLADITKSDASTTSGEVVAWIDDKKVQIGNITGIGTA